ncbi:MAG: hypothetical protein M0Z53_13525 [Thermaerobacter sp.]|nr:hypothetical protein [Thermaerobacter sp.]
MSIRRLMWIVIGTGSLMAMSVPAYADVITANGPGTPVGVVSNTGSVSGQTHRSAIGSQNKITHDAVYIWDD